ncbi:methyltransferase family protein [Hwanghaeella grinnelliae]|nr:isoprenylcysteine carboxylmethyltransferase family protein [Hwanghaeella grinnelliae]
MLFLVAGFLVPQAGLIAPLWTESGGMLRLDQLGALILFGAILGRCWCTLYISAHKKQSLVTAGPYSLCRNPLYLFSFMAAGGVGLMSGSVVIGTIYSLATIALFRGVVRQEERHLADYFEDAYRAYCRDTPRWIPNFGIWRDDRKLVTRPSLLLITLRDGLCLFAFWPFFRLMELAREIGLAPTLLILP